MKLARWAVAASLALAGAAWAGGAAGPYLHAERMLDVAVVPPGAVPVFFLPGSVFARPSSKPACGPLIDQARYWVVPPGHRSVSAGARPARDPQQRRGPVELERRPRDLLRRCRRGTGRQRGVPAELDITVAALGAGMAGIRADAEVVQAGATCAYSGGPAPTAPGNMAHPPPVIQPLNSRDPVTGTRDLRRRKVFASW
jgi:hypothetical protein